MIRLARCHQTPVDKLSLRHEEAVIEFVFGDTVEDHHVCDGELSAGVEVFDGVAFSDFHFRSPFPYSLIAM